MKKKSVFMCILFSHKIKGITKNLNNLLFKLFVMFIM